MTSVTLARPARTAALFLLIACTSLSSVSFAANPTTGSAPAATLQPFVVTGDIRMQGVDLDNGDLGTDGHSNIGTAALEAEIQATWNITQHDLFFWEGRGVAAAGKGGFQTEDTGGLSNGQSFLEWRQSYFEFNNIDDQPYAVRLGRQKLREPYGLWWNQDFDSARALYQSSLFSGNVAAGQNLFNYNTNGSSFTNNDKNVARVLAEGSWQYWYQNFFETRLMYQDDHSGVGVGQVENAQQLDPGTSSLVYGGLRAAGSTHFLATGDVKTDYRLDLLGVAGHENLAATAPDGTSNRIVTGVTGQSVRGWALDASTDVPLPNMKPLLHLGYAYGSGDGNTADGSDHTFREDGLAGNFSRFGALTENTDNYGTVLRPELSNIHILSAGFTTPVFDAASAGVIYRYYRLADAATSLPSSGVVNNLDGVHKNLGQGLDLLFNTDILKEAHLAASHGVTDVTLRSSLGFFWAGKAYGTGDGDVAARGLVEVKIGF
jgi:hypothetical protein